MGQTSHADEQPARPDAVAGGMMATLVSAKDWSATSLGPPEGWPASLRVAVGICLNSRFPMYVWWGPNLINIYNDAYAPMLGRRHPEALGRSAPDVWHELWPLIGPQVEAVMRRGEASWHDRVPLVVERNGFPEEAFFTWSQSPIPDDAGGIGGVLCAVMEETPRVLAERERDRLATQRQLALDSAQMGWWHYDPVTGIATWDERYKEIFGVTGNTRPNEEILRRLHPEDLPGVLAAVEAALDPKDPKPYAARYRVVRDDGSVYWVEAHGLATFAGEGDGRHAVSFVGTVADVTERRRIDEQSRTILESITDAFFAVDEQWRFTYVNRQADHVLGRAPGDLLGKVLWEEYPGLHGSEFERLYLRAATDRVAGSVTAFYPDHNRWYEVHVYPAQGGLSIYFRDVTEQAKVQRDLRNSETQLRAMFDQSAAGIAQLDGQDRFVMANQWFCDLVGYTREELLGGMGMPEITYPGDVQLNLEKITTARGSGEGYRIEKRYVRKDGSLVWASVSGSVLRDVDGKVTAVLGVVTDINDRKQAEAALAASEAKFRQLAETIPQLAWIAEADGRVAWYNRRWYDYTGTTPEQMEGWGWQSVHDPEMLPAVLEQWRRSLTTGEPFEMVFPLRGADGEFRPFLTRVAPLRDAAGAVVQWFGTNTDVTAQRRMAEERERVIAAEQAARAEAERTSRMKDEFLATLSHELRTPLNAILGWSQILGGGGAADPEDLRQGLETIERNARAQTKIIEDLLEMSRIISGKVRLDVQRVNLASVIEAAVETVRHAADAKGVRLELSLDPHAGPVTGDPARLQQVFWNLLSNSVKFCPRGGRVRVRLDRVESHLEVAVVDDGEGIKPEFIPHVFDRFRQGDASSTRRHGGLGLGLSIVKQLVELHGGSVRAQSPGEGLGATFTVVLPVTPVPPEPESEPQNRSDGRPPIGRQSDWACEKLNGMKVLVVDDEADARDLVKRILEDCEAVVATAASASEALEHLRRETPNVLVSDIGMPEEDGYSLIRKVRALTEGEGRDLPAVALTAYARSEDRTRALLAGFQSHLAKPVEPAELIATLLSLTHRTGETRNTF